VLEAHSHCEVPAGCGGAVLEWQDPREGVPVSFSTHSSHRVAELFIDGAKVIGSRARLLPGPHVLALALEPWNPRTPPPGPPPPPWLLMGAVRLATPRAPEPIALAGQWRAVATQPPQTWPAMDFDDAQWPTLQSVALDVRQLNEWSRQSVTALLAAGRTALGLPERTGAWVRLRFILPELP
jgi:hypothetical protein